MQRLLIFLFSMFLMACSTTHSTTHRPAIFVNESLNGYTGYIIHTTEESVYVGYVKNGEPHGKGTAYIKGTYMTGHWVNGKLDGEGIILSPKIDSLTVGKFKEHLLSKEGYVKVKDEIFYGLFESGLPFGEAYCYKRSTPQPCSRLNRSVNAQ